MQTQRAPGLTLRGGVARSWGWVLSAAVLPLGACSDRVDIAKAQGEGGSSGGEVSLGGSTSEQGGADWSGGSTSRGGATTIGSTTANGGNTLAFVCSSDASCNDDPRVSSLWGRCVEGTCECNDGFVLNAETGRCTVASASSWQAEEGWSVWHLAAAANGDAGVVIEAEDRFVDDSYESRVLLHRIGAQGKRIETSRVLDQGLSGRIETLGVAADGENFLYCWALAEKVRCSGLDSRGLLGKAVFEANGTSVEVAFSGGHWVVAYTPSAVSGHAEVVLQRLDRFLQPDLEPVVQRHTRMVDVGKPILGAHANGFVFVGDAEGSDNAHIYRLDYELQQQGSPTALPSGFWGKGLVAATGTQVAVSLSAPYVGHFFSVNSAKEIRQHDVVAISKEGFIGAFAESDGQLIANWLTYDGGLLKSVPASKLGDGPMTDQASETELVMVRIADQLFAVNPTPVRVAVATGVEIRAVSGF